MFHRDALPTITLPLSLEQEANCKHRHMHSSIAELTRYSEGLIRYIQYEGFQPLTKLQQKRQFLPFQRKNRIKNAIMSNKLLEVKAEKQQDVKQNKDVYKIQTTPIQNNVICQKTILAYKKTERKNLLEKIANQLRKNIKYKYLTMKEITKSCQKHRKLKLSTLIAEPIQHKNDFYLKFSFTAQKNREFKSQNKDVCKHLLLQTERNGYGDNDVKGWNDLSNTYEEDFHNLC